MGTLARALGVFGFFRCRWVHTHAPWGTLDFLECALGVLGSNRVVMCTLGHLGGGSVHPWSLCSLKRALGIVRFLRDLGCRWVHPGSLRSLASTLGVLGSSRDFRFTVYTLEIGGFIR